MSGREVDQPVSGDGGVATRFLAARHAVVTGGGRGIGAAVAAELARLGADVTLMGRDTEALERHAALLRGTWGVEAVAAACDVADEGAVRSAFAAARDRLGDPGVLVNNAGIAEAAALADTTLEMWSRMLTVNATGTFLCSREVVDGMVGAGWGRIVNIASVAGLHGASRIGAYCASKHAVVGLTRALGRELGRTGVTVNAVCPGYTDTEMADRATRNVRAATGRDHDGARGILERTLSIGRLVEPTEVASLVGWLCSPAAAAVTGAAIPVGGEPG
jgi:NAD(P)-dependent dehydrogenase (short-subunit alcohol dehydrogenase family)